jgi:hypothetical protein
MNFEGFLATILIGTIIAYIEGSVFRGIRGLFPYTKIKKYDE